MGAGRANALSWGLKMGAVKVLTAAGNFAFANEGAVVVKKASGAATTVTLPPHPGDEGLTPFVWVMDGKGDAATNNITVQGAAGATVDGASTYVISNNYGAALFAYNGSEWNVAGSYGSSSVGALTVTNATVTNETVTNSTVTTLNAATVNATGAFNLTNLASVNAAGSVIGNATALTGTVNIVAGADDTKGVVLPAEVTGQVLLVYSSQATNGLKVYPPVNSTINGGSANAAVVIEGKTLALFLATNGTNYASMFTANT